MELSWSLGKSLVLAVVLQIASGFSAMQQPSSSRQQLTRETLPETNVAGYSDYSDYSSPVKDVDYPPVSVCRMSNPN